MSDLPSAQEINDLWTENEDHMAEMAAFAITCEMLGIDEDTAYAILAVDAEANNEEQESS